MNALDLARWQFAITTVYHFLFVPITIGMAFLVAGLQTAWFRTQKLKYLRATKFFGRLFLINFAIGVVTGIVQEFQFGMNWSSYSRFVGDIFGAPLAIEGLLAFFLESTFLGLWIFGWDRLPKKLHLASIWLAASGTIFSAYFILAANAWMQHPVGYVLNPEKGRAELTNIFDVLTQKTALVTFFHTIPSAAFSGAAFIAGISAWLIIKKKDVEMSRGTLKLGLITMIISFIFVGISGDLTSRVMTEQQPMKMAAAEALYDTTSSAPFSLLTIGSLDGSRSVFQIDIPSVLSFLSTGDFKGVVEGVNDLQTKYESQYGPGDYKPNIPLAYWSFRLMIGFGFLGVFFALLALWQMRRGQLPRGRWFAPAMISLPFIPLLAISFGWIFTETARQPWAVFGLIKTADGVSTVVSAGAVLFTMIAFTLLYGVLAVIEVGLILKTVQIGPRAEVDYDISTIGGSDERPLVMSY
ncbi:MAG: cytochrome ubiquinol oxidase subunit I [Candidatus Nanopelagicaceae bacterium]|nr:cytochrome ubiquinol oxidase subunit I [Candidatus Nanopelagicaceae bacterium]